MSAGEFIIFGLMGLVFLILVAGLVVMAIGGKTNKKYSNKLMMLRVAAQGLAVLMLGLMFMVSR